MNVESFAQFVMLIIKKNDETYVALSYQMLFIENSKKFVSCEVARCKILLWIDWLSEKKMSIEAILETVYIHARWMTQATKRRSCIHSDESCIHLDCLTINRLTKT